MRGDSQRDSISGQHFCRRSSLTSAAPASARMHPRPQAGVALGLARIVAGAFSGWGPDFGALAAGVVLMNLFTGPPLFKVGK